MGEMAGDFPEGLTEPARREQERFMSAYKAITLELHNVPLSILVWGPNPHSESRVARKRNEIRAELRRRGHNAMFSEEIPDTEGDAVSQRSKEFAQARAADLIIILIEDSPGALGETHDFCGHPDIAPNVFVLVPEKYRPGYSGQGVLKDLSEGYEGVHWYEEKELDACNVLTRAIKRADARRHILYYHQLHGRGGRP